MGLLPTGPAHLVSRPGQSQGLLYKQPCDSFIHSVSKSAFSSHSFTALLRPNSTRDSTSSYKIDYVILIKNFLGPEGHQNPFCGSKVTAILLKCWIWPIGGVSSGRVCSCSLRSRFVLQSSSPKISTTVRSEMTRLSNFFPYASL